MWWRGAIAGRALGSADYHSEFGLVDQSATSVGTSVSGSVHGEGSVRDGSLRFRRKVESISEDEEVRFFVVKRDYCKILVGRNNNTPFERRCS